MIVTYAIDLFKIIYDSENKKASRDDEVEHINKYEENSVDNSHNKAITVLKKIDSNGMDLLVSCSYDQTMIIHEVTDVPEGKKNDLKYMKLVKT